MAELTDQFPPEDEAFRISGLEKLYGEGETAVRALRGLDLVVPRGEFIVLLGPSGSGKSTLLNIVGGLDRGTSGSVRIGDEEITSEVLTPRRRSRRRIFQDRVAAAECKSRIPPPAPTPASRRNHPKLGARFGRKRRLPLL